ncbi:MAG: hypothetical protein ACJAY8_001215 [Sphingobacteriales bacterium]|jgi:hypothetical protein
MKHVIFIFLSLGFCSCIMQKQSIGLEDEIYLSSNEIRTEEAQRAINVALAAKDNQEQVVEYTSYSSRIRRFHNPYYTGSYWDPFVCPQTRMSFGYSNFGWNGGFSSGYGYYDPWFSPYYGYDPYWGYRSYYGSRYNNWGYFDSYGYNGRSQNRPNSPRGNFNRGNYRPNSSGYRSRSTNYRSTTPNPAYRNNSTQPGKPSTPTRTYNSQDQINGVNKPSNGGKPVINRGTRTPESRPNNYNQTRDNIRRNTPNSNPITKPRSGGNPVINGGNTPRTNPGKTRPTYNSQPKRPQQNNTKPRRNSSMRDGSPRSSGSRGRSNSSYSAPRRSAPSGGNSTRSSGRSRSNHSRRPR